ncbi:HNH endonuclease [Nocardiopsis terrae]|uniref:HNH endonuclease n=1 Tax=Nocardiopsis terrae TaxID=372655 RepID=UPI003570ED81
MPPPHPHPTHHPRHTMTSHRPRTSTARDGTTYRQAVAQLKREGTNICWLCAQPIDMQLTEDNPQHPMAWTADHQTPLSQGGPPTIDNLREAHRTCNSRRGNRAPQHPPNNSRRW